MFEEYEQELYFINARFDLNYYQKLYLIVPRCINLFYMKMSFQHSQGWIDLNIPYLNQIHTALAQALSLPPEQILNNPFYIPALKAAAVYFQDMRFFDLCIANGLNANVISVPLVQQQIPTPLITTQVEVNPEIKQQPTVISAVNVSEVTLVEAKIIPIVVADNPAITPVVVVKKIKKIEEQFADAINNADLQSYKDLLAKNQELSQITVSLIELYLLTRKAITPGLSELIREIELTIEECFGLLIHKNIKNASKTLLLYKMISYSTEEYAPFKKRVNKIVLTLPREEKTIRTLISQKNSALNLLGKNSTVADNLEDQSTTFEQEQEEENIEKEKASAAKPVTVVNLKPQTVFKRAAKSLDFATCNHLLAEYPQLTLQFYASLKNLLIEHPALQTNSSFFASITLTEDAYGLLLEAALPFPHVVTSILKSLCQISVSTKTYHEHNERFNFSEIMPRGAHNGQLYAKISARNLEAANWVQTNAEELFLVLNKAQPRARVDKHLLQLFGNQVNAEQQTPLMLAIEKNIHLESILLLISQTDRTLMSVDNKFRNALHYFATNLNSERLKYAEVLLDKCAQKLSLQEFNPRDINGDTFFHKLLQNNNEQLVLSLLQQAQKNDTFQIHLQAMLLANNQGITACSLIDEKPADWPDVREKLYSMIPNLLLTLAEQQSHLLEVYTRGLHNFFESDKYDAPLYRPSNAAEYMRLLKVIEDRILLRTAIHIGFASKKVKASLKKNYGSAYSKFHAYFKLESNELNELLIGHDNIAMCLMDSVIMSKDAEYEHTLINSLALKPQSGILPLAISLSWHKILMHYSVEGDDAAFRLTPGELKQSINIIKPHIKFKDPQGYSLLDSTIRLGCVKTTKEIVIACGDTRDKNLINDQTLLLAFACAQTADDKVLQFIFDEHRNKSGIHTRMQSTLFNQALFTNRNPELVKWLITHNFTPLNIRLEDGTWLNPLHHYITLCAMNQTSLNIQMLKELMANVEIAKELLKKNPDNNQSCIHYMFSYSVHKHAEHSNYMQAYKILFEHGMNLTDLATKENQSCLHLPVILNNFELLELFLSRLTTTEITEMASRIDKLGMNVLQRAEDRNKTIPVDQQIIDTLKSFMPQSLLKLNKLVNG